MKPHQFNQNYQDKLLNCTLKKSLIFCFLISLLFPLKIIAQQENKTTNQTKSIEPHIKAATNFVELGNKSFEKGNYKEAQDQYFRALIYDPTFAEAHFGLAKTYEKLNMVTESIREFNSTLIFNAGYTPAYLQLAESYLNQNNITSAFNVYFRALSLNPLFSIANSKNFHVSLRRKNEIETLQKNINEATIKDKKVYVYNDTDVATTLLLARYLNILKDTGAKVIFEPPRVLEDIFKASFENIEIVDWLTLQEDISYDLKAPLGALPLIFGGIKESSTILTAPQKDVDQFKGWISKDGKTIGIAWKPQGELSFFSELSKNATLYSLQSQSSELEITELIDDFDSLSNLSGALSHLDLVISFNNTIAILAASLGKPVWLILGTSNEWMWQGASKDTPWFANMRIFHNPSPQDIFLEVQNFKTKTN